MNTRETEYINQLINEPIDYYKIKSEDLRDGFMAAELTIEPDEDGYVTNQLTEIILNDCEIERTYLINAGVGQGKTKATIDLVLYYQAQGYKIIIACPFLSLISSYKKSLTEKLDSDNSIFAQTKEYYEFPRYEYVENKSIHIITINLFLKNPGESALEQGFMKANYLESFLQSCRENNKKCVVFFDEIHASTHVSVPNFRQL